MLLLHVALNFEPVRSDNMFISVPPFLPSPFPPSFLSSSFLSFFPVSFLSFFLSPLFFPFSLLCPRCSLSFSSPSSPLPLSCSSSSSFPSSLPPFPFPFPLSLFLPSSLWGFPFLSFLFSSFFPFLFPFLFPFPVFFLFSSFLPPLFFPPFPLFFLTPNADPVVFGKYQADSTSTFVIVKLWIDPVLLTEILLLWLAPDLWSTFLCGVAQTIQTIFLEALDFHQTKVLHNSGIKVPVAYNLLKDYL